MASDSTVLFKVELTRFSEAARVQNIFKMSAKERADVEFDDYIKAINELKERVKESIANEMWGWAVDRYEKGVHLLEKYTTFDLEHEQKINEMLFSLYNNIAHCHLKQGNHDDVVIQCKKIFDLPDSTVGDRSKAYHRYGLSEFELGHYGKALELAKSGLKLQPLNRAAQAFYEKVERQLIEDGKKQDALYKKMFSAFGPK